MKTTYDHIRESILKKVGLVKPRLMPPIDVLRESQRCDKFEKLRGNRLIMGAFRYGLLGDKNKPKYDRIACMKRRLDLYEKTGNDEILVDIANLCMLEFVEGEHPLKHFKSIDDGEHTKIKEN